MASDEFNSTAPQSPLEKLQEAVQELYGFFSVTDHVCGTDGASVLAIQNSLKAQSPVPQTWSALADVLLKISANEHLSPHDHQSYGRLGLYAQQIKNLIDSEKSLTDASVTFFISDNESETFSPATFFEHLKKIEVRPSGSIFGGGKWGGAPHKISNPITP